MIGETKTCSFPSSQLAMQIEAGWKRIWIPPQDGAC
jgi:hypothetical protein